MKTCPTPELLERFLGDDVTDEVGAELEKHLEICPTCQGRLDQLSSAPEDEHLRALIQQQSPAARADRVLATPALRAQLQFATPPALLPGAATLPFLPASNPPDGPPPAVLGFEILRELGRGGMGTVYLARQANLHRLVALKTVAAERPGREAALRLLVEARATAALQHPNIVQVHESGQHEGQVYIIMEYCAGGNLADRVGRQPQPPQQAAMWLEILARAVAAAHAAGFVHRDLKPANVLLTEAGQLKVADFGLVKCLDADASVGAGRTQSGALVGTPSYMAPEQASPRAGAIGPTTDVYALGVILYELLTGRPPFQGTEALETLVQVIHNDPLPPRALQPKVPRDLETICLKCLRKEPGRRYDSALALAEDLRRFLDGQPILARPVSPAERAWRWTKKRPAVALLSVGLCLSVVLGLTLVVGETVRANQEWQRAEGKAADETTAREEAQQHERRANREWQRAENKAAEAQAQEKVARHGQAEALLDRGLSLCDQGDIGTGLLMLAKSLVVAQKAGATDLEPGIRSNLTAWRPLLVTPRQSNVIGSPPTGVALSPDGKTAYVCIWANKWNKSGEPGEVLVLDLEKWQWRGQPWKYPQAFLCLALSPDGKTVAAGGTSGRVVLWDTDSGRQLADLNHGGLVYALAFHPSGKKLLSAGGVVAGGDGQGHVLFGGGEVCEWDVLGRKAKGNTLADLAAGTAQGPRQRLPLPAPVRAVVFGPDGDWFVTGGLDGKVQRWATANFQPQGRPLLHTEGVLALALSPDGKRLATGGEEQITRLWNLETGRRVGSPLVHIGSVNALAFSKDGRALITAAGHDKERNDVQVWDAAALTPIGRPAVGHLAKVHAVAVDAAGRRVVTVAEDGVVRLCPVPQVDRPISWPKLPTPLARLKWSRDGKRMVVCTSTGQAWLYDDHGQPVGGPLLHPDVGYVDLSPDGHTVMTASPSNFRLWSVATGHQLGPPVLWPGHTLFWLWFQPDGRYLNVVAKKQVPANGAVLRLWDWKTKRWLGQHELAIEGPYYPLPAPDGEQVVFHSALIPSSEYRYWRKSTGQFSGQAMVHYHPDNYPGGAAFDGKVLVTGGGPTVRFWDAASGAPLGSPLVHPQDVLALDLSADGSLLLTACRDKYLRLWHRASGRQIGPPWQSPAPFPHTILFHPSGRFALTVTVGNLVHRWEVPQPLSGSPERLTLWAESITNARLNETGAALLLTAAEQQQHRDRLRALGGPPEGPRPGQRK